MDPLKLNFNAFKPHWQKTELHEYQAKNLKKYFWLIEHSKKYLLPFSIHNVRKRFMECVFFEAPPPFVGYDTKSISKRFTLVRLELISNCLLF